MVSIPITANSLFVVNRQELRIITIDTPPLFSYTPPKIKADQNKFFLFCAESCPASGGTLLFLDGHVRRGVVFSDIAAGCLYFSLGLGIRDQKGT